MPRVAYFAWVRELIGKAEEDIELPSDVKTVSDLLCHLRAKGEEYDYALMSENVIRVAIDQEHVDYDDSIAGAREIALFPPMTGG
ncbi:molybdopterin converting factor subunit 1 [Agrobacterium pusense]|uniref:molybdopterin converting factor subunit 1 n=1 Tax=Agrobacterium pusense TaxID=648995 RepID=UPI003FD64DEE